MRRVKIQAERGHAVAATTAVGLVGDVMGIVSSSLQPPAPPAARWKPDAEGRRASPTLVAESFAEQAAVGG